MSTTEKRKNTVTYRIIDGRVYCKVGKTCRITIPRSFIPSRVKDIPYRIHTDSERKIYVDITDDSKLIAHDRRIALPLEMQKINGFVAGDIFEIQRFGDTFIFTKTEGINFE